MALLVEDRVEALEGYLGCGLGGFTAVHVNDRLAAPEVAAILADAEVSALDTRMVVPPLWTVSTAGTGWRRW